MFLFGLLLVAMGVACYKRRYRQSAPGIWLDKNEHEINNAPAVVVIAIGALIVATVALLS